MIISEEEKKRIIRLHEATSTDSSGSYETPLFGQEEVEQIFDFMGQPDIVGDDNLVDDDEDIVMIDLSDESGMENFLSDILNLTEAEDNERMRRLHKNNSVIKEQVNQMGTGSGFLGTQGESDRLSKFTQRQEMGEASQDLYEGMDSSNIDADEMSDKEEDWIGGDWDALDDNIKETFRQHKEFKGMEESAIKEKYNTMEKGPLCKIARFLFGWVARIFNPLSWFDKQQRGGGGMGGSGYKPAWYCR